MRAGLQEAWWKGLGTRARRRHSLSHCWFPAFATRRLIPHPAGLLGTPRATEPAPDSLLGVDSVDTRVSAWPSGVTWALRAVGLSEPQCCPSVNLGTTSTLPVSEQWPGSRETETSASSTHGRQRGGVPGAGGRSRAGREDQVPRLGRRGLWSRRS